MVVSPDGGFPPVSLKVFNGEVSFPVVGDGPAFVGVQGFEDGELFAAVGAAWAFFAGVYVLVFPVWAEFLRCWCCHRGFFLLKYEAPGKGGLYFVIFVYAM